MIENAYNAGAQAALGTFKIAVNWAAAPRFLIGQPVTAAKQLMAGSLFKPGEGVLHGAFNPPGMLNKAFTWGMPAFAVHQALKGKGDPNSSTLGNVLGAVGSGVGSAIGFPIAGMLGQPIFGGAGQALGKAVGNFVSPMKYPQMTDPMTGGY